MKEHEQSSRELNVPNSDNEGQLRLLILDAFILLGESLGAHYEEKLAPILGKNWIKELATERQDFGYNLIDPDWVLKEPLRNSASPTRLTLPRGQGFYNKVNFLAKTRNAYFHNQATCTAATVKDVLQYFMELSLEIPLNQAASQYSKAIIRIDQIISGITFAPDKGSLSRIQLLEQQVAEMEEISRQQKEEIHKKQFVLDSALNEAAAHAEKLRTFEAQAEDKELLMAKALSEKSEAEKLAMQLQVEFDGKLAELGEKESMERQYKELLRSLVENRTVESIQGQSESGNSAKVPIFTPGTVWSGEKGLRRLTLSINFREVYDTKTGALLSDKFGKQATDLAQEWLQIKPQGGRVFVDGEGVATAYQGEALIYLGVVPFNLD